MGDQVDQKVLYERVQVLDLSSIRYHMCNFGKGLGWNPLLYKKVELFYRQYLYIQVAYDDFKAVPTDMIDAIWHTHMIFTEKYAADCKFLCGSFIHHDPMFGTRDRAERAFYQSCKKKTFAAFKRDFGVSRETLAALEPGADEVAPAGRALGAALVPLNFSDNR